MIHFRPFVLLFAATLVVSSCSAIQQVQQDQGTPRAQTNFATAEAAFNILIERRSS